MSPEPRISKPKGTKTLVLFGCLLIVAGILVLSWSDFLMTWLIHLVGEEKALGAQNVIRKPDGTVWLTNPVGMMKWSLPFLIPGLAALVSGMALISFCWLRQFFPSEGE
jgi:hypothetical protein